MNVYSQRIKCQLRMRMRIILVYSQEIAVERLFNSRRHLLCLRRRSLSADTMRKLVLLRDMYANDEEF
ncbi:hypothetical protein V1517DRAFT_326032 [Lipomyces orientalis]|uniref:Uncharacterized protein n=1 Tax=Lipomyces orientalis TaxID=1233043 RepID=A0ACC3TKC7_9ASCO